jgi:hypothetical protein
MKFDRPPVTGKIGIEIKAPKGYSIEGETGVIPKKMHKKPNEKEKALDLLYAQLEQLEKQKQEVIELIEQMKAGMECGRCRKK